MAARRFCVLVGVFCTYCVPYVHLGFTVFAACFSCFCLARRFYEKAKGRRGGIISRGLHSIPSPGMLFSDWIHYHCYTWVHGPSFAGYGAD